MPSSDSTDTVTVDGRTLDLGSLISIQGQEGCQDPRCTRRNSQVREDGTWDLGTCAGYHCAACGEPTSMYGHYTHTAWWQPGEGNSNGRPVTFPDGAGYFRCSDEFTAAVAALKEATADGC